MVRVCLQVFIVRKLEQSLYISPVHPTFSHSSLHIYGLNKDEFFSLDFLIMHTVKFAFALGILIDGFKISKSLKRRKREFT